MRAFIPIGIDLLLSFLAKAIETITDSYDAKGRSVRVIHAGSTDNGVITSYSHDKPIIGCGLSIQLDERF